MEPCAQTLQPAGGWRCQGPMSRSCLSKPLASAGRSLWEVCSERQGVWLGLSRVRVFGCVRTQSDMFCFRENEVEVRACNFPLVLILGESKQLCLKIGHGDCRDPSEEEFFGLSGRQLSLQPAHGLVWLLCMYVCMHACSTWTCWLTRRSTHNINRDTSH